MREGDKVFRLINRNGAVMKVGYMRKQRIDMDGRPVFISRRIFEVQLKNGNLHKLATMGKICKMNKCKTWSIQEAHKQNPQHHVAICPRKGEHKHIGKSKRWIKSKHMLISSSPGAGTKRPILHKRDPRIRFAKFKTKMNKIRSRNM